MVNYDLLYDNDSGSPLFVSHSWCSQFAADNAGALQRICCSDQVMIDHLNNVCFIRNHNGLCAAIRV